MTDRSEHDTVAFEMDGRIAWVKFNRPEKRNCMSPKLNRRMMEVLDELEHRDDVGVLVLTGEGTAWSAGMDLKEYFRETGFRPHRPKTYTKHLSLCSPRARVNIQHPHIFSCRRPPMRT